MQYALLIYQCEAEMNEWPDERKMAFFGEYKKLTEDLNRSGKRLGGHPLQAVRSATTVRVREGKTLVTDGPFAETREQLAGFYIIDASDLDEAIEIAARIPTARCGSIEIRPVLPAPPSG